MKSLTDEILAELKDARSKFHNFNSYHEGYGVLKEELDELWAEIMGGQDQREMRAEAIQVAAMAIRFIEDCCDIEGDKTGRVRG